MMAKAKVVHSGDGVAVVKLLEHGVKIRLVPGATVLARYIEKYDPRFDKDGVHHWVGELWLVNGRVKCQQAYDEAEHEVTDLAWVRREIAALLDQIAPEWEVM
jgi:hypothetical protein